jgi:hypothetical protein
VSGSEPAQPAMILGTVPAFRISRRVRVGGPF